VEPEPKQFWIAGAGAKNFQMVEPEPEFGFPFNEQFVGQASCTNNTVVFSFPWTKSFWSRSQKLLMSGAGTRNLSSVSTALVFRTTVIQLQQYRCMLVDSLQHVEHLTATCSSLR